MFDCSLRPLRSLRFRQPNRATAALIAIAVVAAIAPLPPSFVERVYSTGVYAAIQPALTTVSNVAPFALLDVLIVLVAAAWLVLLLRDVVRRRRPRAVAVAALRRTVVWAATVYLVFLCTWGFNYRRLRLVETLQFDAASVTPAAARDAAASAVGDLNRLHDPAHASGWPEAGAVDPGLARSFARAVADVEKRPRVTVGRPKATLLDWYFRRAGIDGMTDPVFLETLVARDVLPFERPFVTAHEWSHLAGIADEGEANFVAWLACVRGSNGDRYSASLFLYGELARSLGARDRAEIGARLAAGPRDDLRAIRERIQRHLNPRVAAAGWRVYDSYLKANRVEAGTASYAEVVRLVLGVRFGEGLRPLRR